MMRLGVLFLVVCFLRSFGPRRSRLGGLCSSGFFLRCFTARSPFAFRLVVGQDPVRQASGEASRYAGVRLQAGCRPYGLLFKIRLALLGLAIFQRLERRCHRAPTVLGQ